MGLGNAIKIKTNTFIVQNAIIFNHAFITGYTLSISGLLPPMMVHDNCSMHGNRGKYDRQYLITSISITYYYDSLKLSGLSTCQELNSAIK